MFRSKTVFVVGAGASKELKLPTGPELKGRIAELLDMRFDYSRQIAGDESISEAFRIKAKSLGLRDTRDFVHIAWAMRDALPQAISIDNYIDAHNENPNAPVVGKLGIAKAILDAERSSSLYEPPSEQVRYRASNIQNSWLLPFVQMATDGLVRSKVEHIFNNLSFIVFNYDRCIEHTLAHALRTYYSIPLEEAEAIVNKANIIHPYGVVGKLPWQSGEAHPTEFGRDPSASDLVKISSNLMTFTERVEEHSVLAAIRDAMEQARTIVFLGFAYYDQNMKLLASQARPERIYGTAFGISDPACEVAKISVLNSIRQSQGPFEIRNNLTCTGLLNEFGRSIPA